MRWKSGLVVSLLCTSSCATVTPTETLRSAKAPSRCSKPAIPIKTTPDQTPPKALQLALAPSLAKEGEIEAEVVQDFNNDGTADLALVILSPKKPDAEDDIQPNRTRTLVMGIRHGQGFRSIQSSTCLALCTRCGGVMGDPFQGIAARKNNILTISNYGGSRFRWSVNYNVAWRKGAFYVIGVDSQSHDIMNPNNTLEKSVNLLKGTDHEGANSKRQPHKLQPARIDQCEEIERIPTAVFP